MDNSKEKKFDFWNDHSLEFLEMAMKRDYQERVESSGGYGKKSRECGDTIEIFLDINQGIIQTISYDIKGCLFSHACTNTLIRLVRGLSVEQAESIKPQQIADYLKTLPENEFHCAENAIAAFRLAIKDYQAKLTD